MRIALVVPNLEPQSGGPAQNVPRLAEALAEQGLDVEVHAVGATPASSRPRLDYWGSAPARPRRLGRSPQMAERLLATRADILHANCLWMLPLGYAARAAQAKGTPLVISPRGMLAPWSLKRSRWKKALASLLVHPGALQGATAWHATSLQEADDIRRLGFGQPICVAPNGVDPAAADERVARSYYLHAAPELEGKRILLFYSRLHAKKRVRELLADFARIAEGHADWHLLAVGIPEEFTVAALRGEAERLGIGARTTILDGRQAPKPYSLAQLFVLPTHDENFGGVVVEALASGVPVLTTTGTPWEDLNRVGAGRWVPIEEFPGELERLMALAPADLAAAGERGRRWVLDAFDWREIAATMKRFYEGLVPQGTGAGAGGNAW